MDYKERMQEYNKRKMQARENLSGEDLEKWYKENPQPVYSREDHRRDLNKCLKEAEEKNEKRCGVFCPIFGGMCWKKCESYVMATVRGVTYDENCPDECEPYVVGGKCTAYALHGNEKV